jgi:hypothetical protein
MMLFDSGGKIVSQETLDLFDREIAAILETFMKFRDSLEADKKVPQNSVYSALIGLSINDRLEAISLHALLNVFLLDSDIERPFFGRRSSKPFEIANSSSVPLVLAFSSFFPLCSMQYVLHYCYSHLCW